MIKRGGLVSFPTETVYGLGADATNSAAVAKIFAAKQRPSFNPLIIHVDSLKTARRYAAFNDIALGMAHAFWAGPLTLVLPRLKNCLISDLVTAGLDTIAVRVPAHKAAQSLLAAAGVPIAAPSANISGALSPTTPKHVADGLGERVDIILAGGACAVGLESTIVDLTTDTPVILRAGAVTAAHIAAHLGVERIEYAAQMVDSGAGDKPKSPKSPKSPGQLLKHYAPNTPVRLKAFDIAPNEALLAFGSTKFMSVRGVCGGAVTALPDTQVKNLSEGGDLNQAAANLFAHLKALDRPEHSTIAVMDIPDIGLGVAINDRLRRAAQT